MNNTDIWILEIWSRNIFYFCKKYVRYASCKGRFHLVHVSDGAKQSCRPRHAHKLRLGERCKGHQSSLNKERLLYRNNDTDFTSLI